MLIYKSGDLLKAEENIIAHQVNCQGIMGGGLAKQIANSYPDVEKKYKKVCKSYDYDYLKLRGQVFETFINKNQKIANCFTQKPNFDTDYSAIEKGFDEMLMNAKRLNQTLAVPYWYGCGIANGKWEIIENIFKKLSSKYEVDISVYKLEDICY